MREFLNNAAGFLMVLAFIRYTMRVLKGQTKPTRISWILWLSLDTLAAAGMYFKGSLNGQMMGCMVGWLVLVAVIWKGENARLTKLDLFCLIGGITGITLWLTFDDPLLAVIIAMSVVFLASFPTFASVWRTPDAEDGPAWIIFVLSSLCAVGGMPKWSWEDSLQPITFLVIQGIVSLMVYIHWRPKTRLQFIA